MKFIAALLLAATTTMAAAQEVKVEVSGGHGSGVYIGENYFLTAAHVMEGATEAKVSKGDASYNTRAEWINFKYDFALMKSTEPVKFPAASLDCVSELQQGDPIYSVGYPRDLGNIYTRGVVSSTTGPKADWAEANIAIIQGWPGVSGGPVYDAFTNKLRALFVGGYPGTTYAFLIPVKAVCNLLPEKLRG